MRKKAPKPPKPVRVCFHSQARCHYCWPPSGRPPTFRLVTRCTVCSKRCRRRLLRCARCDRAGFSAGTLW